MRGAMTTDGRATVRIDVSADDVGIVNLNRLTRLFLSELDDLGDVESAELARGRNDIDFEGPPE